MTRIANAFLIHAIPSAYHALLALLLAELRNQVQRHLLLFVVFGRLAGGAWPLLERASGELLFPGLCRALHGWGRRVKCWKLR